MNLQNKNKSMGRYIPLKIMIQVMEPDVNKQESQLLFAALLHEPKLGLLFGTSSNSRSGTLTSYLKQSDWRKGEKSKYSPVVTSNAGRKNEIPVASELQLLVFFLSHSILKSSVKRVQISFQPQILAASSYTFSYRLPNLRKKVGFELGLIKRTKPMLNGNQIIYNAARMLVSLCVAHQLNTLKLSVRRRESALSVISNSVN